MFVSLPAKYSTHRWVCRWGMTLLWIRYCWHKRPTYLVVFDFLSICTVHNVFPLYDSTSSSLRNEKHKFESVFLFPRGLTLKSSPSTQLFSTLSTLAINNFLSINLTSTLSVPSLHQQWLQCPPPRWRPSSIARQRSREPTRVNVLENQSPQ